MKRDTVRRLGTERHALMVLAHLRCGHSYAQPATGFGISLRTVYRYVTKAVELLAALAPDLAEAVRTASRKAFVILDGTLLSINRVAADQPLYSGKAAAPRGRRPARPAPEARQQAH